MAPLRKKMIEAMQLRGCSPRTRDSYLNAVTGLADYYKGANLDTHYLARPVASILYRLHRSRPHRAQRALLPVLRSREPPGRGPATATSAWRRSRKGLRPARRRWPPYWIGHPPLDKLLLLALVRAYRSHEERPVRQRPTVRSARSRRRSVRLNTSDIRLAETCPRHDCPHIL